ncbi:hypothetical protein B0H19DRAFT_1199523, partial [Mycena capillaripes]
MASLSQRLADAKRLGGTFFFKRGHPRRGNAQVLFDTLALQLAVNVPQLKPRISRAVEENPTLVGSRPEAHICEVMEGPSFRGVYRKFNVKQSFDDVRTYFRSEFAKIHHDHSTMASVPTPWPSEAIMEQLVDESSGYFIYATTVIKFVGDKHFRPTARLKIITDGTETSFQSPFGALDQLYTQILSAVPPPHNHLVAILRVVILGMEPGDAELSLRGLHSVVQRNEWEKLEIIHASFRDFLSNPSRAGSFYVRDSAGLQNLARSILTELSYMYEDTTKNRTDLIGW